MDALVLSWLLPQYGFLLAALVAIVVPVHLVRVALAILAPLHALLWLLTTADTTMAAVDVFGFDLTLVRLDGLSRPFALVFAFAATCSAIYAAHVRSGVQAIATLLYAGAGIGAVLAGDLVTLFLWWEATAITSVFLVWANRTEHAFRAGLRYLAWQVASGVLLFAGVAIHFGITNSLQFDGFILDNPAAWVLLAAIGIKAAFPFLNPWLADAYPAATPTGTVTMSIFTTKMAIYALARSFPGSEILVLVGCVMALYPIVLAILEDDMRRSLAYALNSQLGLMVAGIGIGGALGVNGAVSHAAASVLYQGVLFMGVGAIIAATGAKRFSEVGGLANAMPVTFICVLVGCTSISSVPFFAGFVSKSITIDAAAKTDAFVWAALLAASVGGVLHTGLKLPWLAFLRGNRAPGPKAPLNMMAAMLLMSIACLAFGMAPSLFYAALPETMEYEPYTASHLVAQGQMLALALLVFLVAVAWRVWPIPKRSRLLEIDWVWRGLLGPVVAFSATALGAVWSEGGRGWNALMRRAQGVLRKGYGPDSFAARVLSTGNMAIWIAIILGAALFANLLDIR